MIAAVIGCAAGIRMAAGAMADAKSGSAGGIQDSELIEASKAAESAEAAGCSSGSV
ncbi:MAG: hypothetical protein ACLTQL_12010 [Eisenbergiella sp.]